MSIPRTGTLESYTTAGVHRYRGRLRLANGKRPRIKVPLEFSYSEARAREWIAAIQEQENVHHAGALALAKPRALVAHPLLGETAAAEISHLRMLSNMAMRDAMCAWTAKVFGSVWSNVGIPEPTDPLPPCCGVYFASAGALVKIGFARSVARRFSEGSAWCPVRCHLLAVMPGDLKTEGALHTRFANLRVSKEWFVMADGLIDEINSIRARVDIRTLPTRDVAGCSP